VLNALKFSYFELLQEHITLHLLTDYFKSLSYKLKIKTPLTQEISAVYVAFKTPKGLSKQGSQKRGPPGHFYGPLTNRISI